ncbi:CDP-glycerol glycerophosphotransferase family protein [Maribacter sp. 2307ULW6-5]|uniref:CDP-glycerol glycerophosphotransferase family protein n=1 Tax=Maribacter sp. 2307ULW6-5 TaxID=3386275 RepID=UPI0039BC2E87
MKCILFCQNPYAFGILWPIREALKAQNDDFLWYVGKSLFKKFPFGQDPVTTSMLDLQWYESDVVFVPGNEVPHYLRGVKTQVFHGLAGEKKGHFRIRHYFDLYLTQGPYFTERFNKLKAKYRDFEVMETGWPKLDVFATDRSRYADEKKQLLAKHQAQKILLYAPTFSPSLTSAFELYGDLEKLARSTNHLIIVKFHDLMSKEGIQRYQNLAEERENVLLAKEKNIVKHLLLADLLISDTSSVIYEFLLLNKPVVSYKNISKNIGWDNLTHTGLLLEHVQKNLDGDPYEDQRSELNQRYHPYRDGKSAQRMVNAVKLYMDTHGVPEERVLPLSRKIKMNKKFGKPVTKPWKGAKQQKLSAVFITYNEILHIDEVLENVQFADEIIVVDSFSTDGTVERIKAHARVKLIQRPFENYTDQKSFALAQASHDWVLFMDADERLTDALKNEVAQTINSEPMAAAYFFYRTFMFKQKVLRYSGWQSDKNFRLFRKSKVAFTQERIVHETLIVDGPIGILKNKLIHYSYKDYEDYKGKMVKYGQMKAQEAFKRGERANAYHFFVRPAFKFFNHFILRLGFLDGKKGCTISYLNALGVHARYQELDRLWRQEDKP